MEFVRCGQGHATPNLGGAKPGELAVALCGMPGRVGSAPFDEQSEDVCPKCRVDVTNQLREMHGAGPWI